MRDDSVAKYLPCKDEAKISIPRAAPQMPIESLPGGSAI